MPKYFTYLANNCSPANSLQKKALAVLQAESNLLVNNAKAFISDLRNQIVKLNIENPRCSPLKLSTHEISKGGIGIYLGGAFTVGFYLYRVKNGGQNA